MKQKKRDCCSLCVAVPLGSSLFLAGTVLVLDVFGLDAVCMAGAGNHDV